MDPTRTGAGGAVTSMTGISAPVSLTIISVGADRNLLALRERVFRTAGFHVLSLNPDEASQIAHFIYKHVWVFCGTIQPGALRRIANRVRMNSPKSKLLLLDRTDFTDGGTSLFDAVLNPLSVDTMLSAIKEVASCES